MTKTRKVVIIALSILIAAKLCWIWGNSLVPSQKSAEQSESVYDKVKPVLDAVVGEDVITHALFRKTAHFAEFFTLGFEITLMFFVLKKLSIRAAFSIFSLGLAAAVIDESLQILSKRGAAVSDILLDFCGYLTSAVIFLAVFYLIKLAKNRKNSDKTA